MRSNAASTLSAASSSAPCELGPAQLGSHVARRLQGAFDRDACRLGVLDHATAQG
jgi:hypothetical protein